MRIGDLVRIKTAGGYSPTEVLEGKVGIIIDWEVIYDRFGDPVEKHAIVNWGADHPAEQEWRCALEVVSRKWA